MQSNHSKPPIFTAIRARSLLGMLVLAFIVPYLGATLFWPQWLTAEEPSVLEALLDLTVYILLTSLILIACLEAGVIDQISFGKRPGWRQIWAYLLLGIPLIGVAIFSMYIMYLPLSYVFPDFVVWLLLESPPIIWWRFEVDAVLATGINVILIAIIAPIVEEILFRGFLLNRWCQKYGTGKAVFFSSLIFAGFHFDIIGGFVFGAVLSLIYLRTKTLVGPILVHISNNTIVILILITEGIIYDGPLETTIDEFRAYWWLAPIGAAIGFPWLVWFLRRLTSRGSVFS